MKQKVKKGEYFNTIINNIENENPFFHLISKEGKKN